MLIFRLNFICNVFIIISYLLSCLVSESCVIFILFFIGVMLIVILIFLFVFSFNFIGLVI
jgi:hypothetical protein